MAGTTKGAAMRLGILFDGFDDAREMMRLAREAEAAGADSVWIAEHMGYREAVVAAAAIAATTNRVRLVPTAVSPYLWHPTPTAMSFATLTDLAPGRVALAVSVGNVLNLRESGHEPVKPVRALREFVEDLRALWRGEAVQREALTYRLDGARMMFKPAEEIPIYVASTGPQVLDLSGRIADGVLLSGGQSLAFTRQCLEWAAKGVAAAGRPPAAVARASFIYFSVSGDGREAVADLKQKLAFLFRSDRQAANIATSGLKIDHAAIIAAVKRRDIDSAARLLPDEAIDAFTVGGTPDNCRKRLRAYVEAGVEEPVLQISGTPENKAIALELVREFAGW
jgi:5,10-methylenetetrahydromethanopterin reductase